MGVRESKNLKIVFLVLGIIIIIGIGITFSYMSNNQINPRTIWFYTAVFLIIATIISFIFKADRKYNKTLQPINIVRSTLIFLTLSFLPIIQAVIYLPLSLADEYLSKFFYAGDFEIYPYNFFGLAIILALSLIYSIIIIFLFAKVKPKSDKYIVASEQKKKRYGSRILVICGVFLLYLTQVLNIPYRNFIFIIALLLIVAGIGLFLYRKLSKQASVKIMGNK